MRKLLRSLCVFGVIIYISACAYLYVFQRDILYKPHKDYSPPSVTLLPDITEIEVQTSDGIALKSWFHAPQTSEKTILYLHGNAGGLTKRSHFYRQIIDNNYGVLALEYRGFSQNKGSPTEAGLYEDARAALRYLAKNGIQLNDVVIMGRSLGTGVATQMAVEHELHALILISPYTSIADAGAERYPFAPINLLLKDKFDSVSKAHLVEEPVLIFHGTKDRITPYSQGLRLIDAFNPPKKLITYEGKNHGNLPFDDIMLQMNDLLFATEVEVIN